MARRKPKAELTVSFNVTVPRKLARRMDREIAKIRKLAPYQTISRSAFYAHAVAEWLALLTDPATTPTLPVRQRARPPAARPGPVNIRSCPRLTPAEVRKIRRDKRPTAEVAKDFGVDRVTIWRCKSGGAWRSVL